MTANIENVCPHFLSCLSPSHSSAKARKKVKKKTHFHPSRRWILFRNNLLVCTLHVIRSERVWRARRWWKKKIFVVALPEGVSLWAKEIELWCRMNLILPSTKSQGTFPSHWRLSGCSTAKEEKNCYRKLRLHVCQSMFIFSPPISWFRRAIRHEMTK